MGRSRLRNLELSPRRLLATVGFGQCTPGAWLGRTAFIDCSWCVDPYMAMNIFCGNDGHSYVVEPYRSYDGVNRYDYNWIDTPAAVDENGSAQPCPQAEHHLLLGARARACPYPVHHHGGHHGGPGVG